MFPARSWHRSGNIRSVNLPDFPDSSDSPSSNARSVAYGMYRNALPAAEVHCKTHILLPMAQILQCFPVHDSNKANAVICVGTLP